MKIIYTVVILCSYITISLQSSCYSSTGQKICNPRSCPKKLACRGNVGKDSCGCCTVCLIQENEPCSTSYKYKANCEHKAPYCVKLPHRVQAICISLKTAIQRQLPKFTKRLRKCRKSKHYKKIMKNYPLHCFLEKVFPAYFCRKNPNYLGTDCCIHSNGCNPNKKLYERIEFLT